MNESDRSSERDNTLEALLVGQRDVLAVLKALSGLTAECREVVAEAGGIANEQGKEILSSLHALSQRHAPGVPRHQWRGVLGGVCGLLLGGMLMGLVWLMWPVAAHEALASQVDQVIVQQFATLPKATQESLLTVYRHTGFVAPNVRAKPLKPLVGSW